MIDSGFETEQNLNKVFQKVPLFHWIPVNYACFPVCFGSGKNIQKCLLILETQGVHTSLHVISGLVFNSSSNLCHYVILPLHDKTVTYHRKTVLLNWTLQSITQAKCCTTSFRACLVFCSNVENLQKNALPNISFVQSPVSSKSQENLLVWIKTYPYIGFVPECRMFGKHLEEERGLA